MNERDARIELDHVRYNEDLTRLPLPARQSPEAAAAQQASVKAIERLLNVTAHVAPAVAASTPQATLVGFTTEGAQFIKGHLAPLVTMLNVFIQRVMVDSHQYDENMWQAISTMMRAVADAGDRVESFVFNAPVVQPREEGEPGGAQGDRGRQQRPPVNDQ